MDRKREKLEKEIADKMAELNALEDVPSGIVPLENYSTQDKVDFFDKFYKFVEEHVKQVEDDGYEDEDASHWFYEEGMSILNINDRNAFWKYYRTLQS